jgi:hypothetical protein
MPDQDIIASVAAGARTLTSAPVNAPVFPKFY